MHERLVQSKHYAQSLTPLDRLAHAFKWRPAHHRDRNGTVHLKVSKAQRRELQQDVEEQGATEEVAGADRQGGGDEAHGPLASRLAQWHLSRPKLAGKLLRQAKIKFENLQ